MKKIKNLFSCLRKDNKKSRKPHSSIISANIEEVKDTWDNYLFKPFIKGTFKVCTEMEDGKKEYFTIVVKTNWLLSLNVKILDNNSRTLDNIGLTSQIKILDSKSFWLNFERIDSQNLEYRGYGFGRLMMEAMFYTLYYFSKENDMSFLFLRGTIGTNANDTPERSIPLYASFNNFSFGDYKIKVDTERLNVVDRDIYYKIVQETV